MRSNFQQIISYCLGLRTQNPGLGEVDFKPSPKRGSDKINTQKQGRKTQKKASRIIQPGRFMSRYRVNQHLIVLKLDSVSMNKFLVTELVTA